VKETAKASLIRHLNHPRYSDIGEHRRMIKEDCDLLPNHTSNVTGLPRQLQLRETPGLRHPTEATEGRTISEGE